MRIEKAGPDVRAKTEADVSRLADARGRERIAEPPELRQLETHGVDDAV